MGRGPPTDFRGADEAPARVAWSVGFDALAGPREGSPQGCPAPFAACARGGVAALADLAQADALCDIDGATLLTTRAALRGLTRNGSISPGGGCRLLACTDGWLAANLSRAEDWNLLPAWLERAPVADWGALAAVLREYSTIDCVQRARWLGLAVAAEPPVLPALPALDLSRDTARAVLAGCHVVVGHPLRDGSGIEPRCAPRVVDLSSLWAGPLCARLLGLCGAEVIKVEALGRPDGARRGSTVFYAQLNAGKASVALDFQSAAGAKALQALLAGADIIIESARPRALRQLGIDAEQIVAGARRPTWVAISGYGRDSEHENAVAFGDDAAIAAGVSRFMVEAGGSRCFVGDALADPLTGIHAALAAWASWRTGGGRLLALALRDVVRDCLCFDLPGDWDDLRRRQAAWSALVRGASRAPASARLPTGAVARLGCDTQRILGACGALC